MFNSNFFKKSGVSLKQPIVKNIASFPNQNVPSSVFKAAL